MALNRIPCPECGAGLKSSSGFVVGKTVCCPKCETYFTVEEPAEENQEMEESESPKKSLTSSPSSKGKPGLGKKPIKAASIADDDDEDEEEEEDRPRKKKKKKRRDDDEEERSYKNSPLRFAILGLLIIVMLVGAFFLYKKYRKEHTEEETASSSSSSSTETAPQAFPKTNFGPGGPQGKFGPGGPPGNFFGGAPKEPRVSAVEDQAGKALSKLGADVVRDGAGRVILVDLSDKNAGEETIQHLKEFKKLFSLDLSSNPITDKFLEQTQGMWPDLTELELDRTMVTDKGVGMLEQSTPRLQVLSLTGNEGVTDQAIASLVNLPLKRLKLTGTKVTDAGLITVKRLNDLEELYCSNREITDKGIAGLKGLLHLRSLALADTQLTDRGLSTLSGFKTLEFLVLDRTKVTDAGMAHLKGLTGLQRLRLAGTSVTADGEAALKKAIPGVVIERDAGLSY
jgi:Leucine-rich repeat (LRR) protein